MCVFLLKHFDTGIPGVPTLPAIGFGIGQEVLTKITREHDFSALQGYGGASNKSCFNNVSILPII